MNLNALIEQTVSKVLEGGAAMSGDRIPQARVKPAIDAFTKEVLKGLRYKSVKPIGSTGKKESSGDLDLGLDTDMSLEELTDAIEEKGFKVKMNKGLGEVSVLFPFEGLNAQVDLMVGPEAWTQTQYYGPGDKESKYKGIHVRGLVNAIMQVVLGKSVSPARGLFSKTDPEKKYSQDWTQALTALNQKSREPWGPADLQQPFEKMWEKANRSFSPSELAEIRNYYASFMKSTKQTMPSELGEASHMAYDKVQPWYGNKSGAQVGGGNIGGARNRGKPGYPVPQELGSRRGAEGPGDEGFKTQDPSDIYETEDKAAKLAADYVRLHNAASKEFTKAFNAIGARMWNADDAHPLKKKHQDFIATQMRRMKDSSIKAVYGHCVQFPLTVMDSYPKSRKYKDQLEKVLHAVQDKYQGEWEQILNAASGMNEAVDPGEIQKGIPHIDDLKPEEFMAFLKKYAEQPVSLEISEKVDGSARITFGKGAGHVWTQTKNGTRKAMSNQYPDKPMYIAVKKAHEALESKAREILAAWPQDVDFFTAEVLYTRIPNSIEYGPNVLMIHGVHGTGKGGTFNDVISKQLSNQVIQAAGGKLSDGKEEWLFEYKRTINPQDVMVDVKKEYKSLGELYQELQKTPRDKNLKTKFQNIQKQVKEKLIGQLRKQKSAYGPEGGDVEGLVFRDLESGSMVKLVDKDYFTKLNEFLWAHRKMLDMGGKVDGAWKKGVMQGFREVVASQVLGDTSAASTMLVKNLLALSQDVEGKTPEQRADKTLAKYIKTKNLMSGDFATSFQRSLMGAFKDFKLLKQEWEQFRSKPQSMEFGGKKREFPPEHVERTEQAFQGTEAALAGIKAGMEQAATIKHPMTQKVALLKLFMGHKFEKLVSALSGGPVEEEIIREGSPDGWMEPGGDPLATQVIQLYNDKLAKHGIRVGKFLGAGFYGNTFDIGGGKVLKITSDPDEAKASNHLKGKNLKHVVKYYEVFKFPHHPKHSVADTKGYPINNFYGIVMEKVKVLDDDGPEMMAVTSAVREFQDVLGGAATKWGRSPHAGEWGSTRPSAELLQEYIAMMKQGGNEGWQEVVETLQNFQILEMRDELIKHHITFSDMHGGNLGQRADGTWVAFDLGSESMSPGSEPPILEGGPIDRGTGPTDLSGDQRIDGQVELETFVRESIQRIMETQNPNSTIGVTIGRFQPFHAGHAAIIRKLTSQFSNVVVFVAGQKQDKKNPFSHDLRLRMMELSLPDVWSKVKVFPASIQGKGPGYVPGLSANAAASNQAAIPENGAITVLVGEDRVQDNQTQAKHNSQHQGEPGYYSGAIEVQALPGVKNDDDAERISGTRVREAIALNKVEDVKKMLDPHLSQNAEFEGIYTQLRDEMKRWGLVREIIESIINELGMGAADGGPGATRGGGTSGWSRAILARDMTGDEVYNQLLRSPSTRMLPMTNKGTPNDHLPGQDVLDQRDEDEVGLGDPTDLSDAIYRTISRIIEGVPSQATKDKHTAAAHTRMKNSWPILSDPQNPAHKKEREWYNGKRQQYGWPELPPLKAPVISKISAKKGDIHWIPWSDEIKKIPFQSAPDETGEVSVGGKKRTTTRAIGPGEERVLAQLGTSARKSDDPTHDVDIDEAIVHRYQIVIGPGAEAKELNIKPGQYEVKNITAGASAFSGAKGDKRAWSVREKYNDLKGDIIKFIQDMDSNARNQAQAAGVNIDELYSFINGPGESMTSSGHIAPNAVNELMAITERLKQFRDSPQSATTAPDAVKVAKAAFGFYRRSESYWENPSLIGVDYYAIGDISDLFASLTGVIIVDKDEGFAVIPVDKVNDYIDFHSISKGSMKIILKRSIPEMKMPDLPADPFTPKTSEPLPTPAVPTQGASGV